MGHPINRRRFLYLTGGAAAAAGLAACSPDAGSGGGNGGGGGDKPSGPLKFWSGYSTTDPNDKTKKPNQFWIYQASERFTEKTGVKVQIEALPGDSTMFTKIRTASIGGQGPDVASVWSGSYMLSIKSFLEPMKQYYSDEEMAQLSGWAAVTDGFDPQQADKILGVPNGTDGAMACLFNSDVLSKAGVDPNAWPIDFDGWLGELDKIKSTGVTPLTLGKFSYLFFAYDTWLAQTVGGPTGIGALSTGERNFSDPEIVEMTNKWLKLRDYAIKGAATTDDGQAMQQVYNGKAAIAVGGAGTVSQMRERLKNGAAVGKLPNISAAGVQGGTVGGTGVGFIVSKSSKRKEDAVAYIKHLLSQDEQKKFAESNEPGPLVGRTDMKDVYSDPLTNKVQSWGIEENNTFWPDNTFAADLVNELGAQGQLVWNGQINAAEFLSRLDKKRDSIK